MDKLSEINWPLAKAELMEVQAAFCRIMLEKGVTFELLRSMVQDHIEDLDSLATGFRKEAAKIAAQNR
jgi:hypothetical protein